MRSPISGPPTPVFVHRQAELARLNGLLDQALGGHGQVAFITGEPGAGKTSLVAEFARRAAAANPDLLYVYADCDARTGAGDAYLPFREMLALLAGDTDAEVAQGNITEENASRLKRFLNASGEVVFEAGTEVLGAFIPGAGLVARLAALVARGGGGGAATLGPARIQEQYTRIIRAAAERQPLVLAVDDLQWADAASVDLLFHLARRVEGSRVLLLGSYRPNDVAMGRDGERHPLEPVVAELRRYGAEVVANLDDAGEADRRSFVADLLATRPHRFDDPFVDRLVEHTGGHALFVVEVLSALAERGGIARGADGVWYQAREIDWSRLPSRVEGVIEERVVRLDAELRGALRVASVEGDEFNAEVVARVQALEPRSLIRRLGAEADRGHRLIAVQGVRRIGLARLSGYRFRHALFQRYLYGSIDEVERPLLHQDVGEALEALLGEDRDALAPRLAAHFTEAADHDRAARYLLVAGRAALRLSAYAEALPHLRSGVEQVGAIPPGPGRDRLELSTLAALGVALIATRGYADPEVQRVFDRAHALVAVVGDDDELVPILLGVLTFHLARGRVAAAAEIAARRIPLARRRDDPDALREAIVSHAFTRFYMGDLAGATATIHEAAAIAPRDMVATAARLFSPDSSIHRGLALLHWLRGDPAAADAAAEAAVRVAGEAGATYGRAAALGFTAVLRSWQEDLQGTLESAEQCRALAEREGYAFWIPFASVLAAWAEGRRAIDGGRTGEADRARDRVAGVLAAFAAAGTELWRPYFLTLVADLHERAGDERGARAALDSALETAERTGEVFWLAEILRRRAGFLRGSEAGEGRAMLERAREVARSQGAGALEARVETTLAALGDPDGGPAVPA